MRLIDPSWLLGANMFGVKLRAFTLFFPSSAIQECVIKKSTVEEQQNSSCKFFGRLRAYT